MTQDMVSKLFAAIDEKDAHTFAEYLTEDISFRFGNQEAVVGKESVESYVAGFFDSIAGISHSIENVVITIPVVVCHGHVSYTRHDGSVLRVPFANIFNIKEGLIKDYMIFLDNSALYAV